MSLRDDLKAYADGELDPQRSEEMRTALERDPILQRELAEILSISSTIRAAAIDPKPVGMFQTIDAVLEAGRVRSSWGQRWVLAGVSCVLCGVIAAVIFPVFSQAKFAAKNSKGRMAFRFGDQSNDAAGFVNGSGSSSASAKAMSAAPVASPPTTPEVKHDSRNKFATSGTVNLSAVRGNVAQRVGRTRDKSPLSDGADAGKAIPTKSMNTPLVGNGGNADGRKSRPSFKRMSAKPQIQANPVEVVALSFDSPDAGAKQILGIVGKYQVNLATAKRQRTSSLDLSKPQTIIVDLPEGLADKTVDELRMLATSSSPARVNGVGQGSAAILEKSRRVVSTTTAGENTKAPVQADAASKAGLSAKARKSKDPTQESAQVNSFRPANEPGGRPKTRRIKIIIYQHIKTKPVP